MDANLHRFWVRLMPTGDQPWASDFGVSAYDEQDALAILSFIAFSGAPLPPVLEVLTDVDIRDLDQGHVIPNMNSPNWRGIWFPMGFDRGPFAT